MWLTIPLTLNVKSGGASYGWGVYTYERYMYSFFHEMKKKCCENTVYKLFPLLGVLTGAQGDRDEKFGQTNKLWQCLLF